MSVVQVHIDLPEELAHLLDPSGRHLAERVREAVVVQLVERDAISSGKGAELLGIPKEQFRELLRERGVPYQDVAAADFSGDLRGAERYVTRKPT